MKKIPAIALLLLLAGCAKDLPYDPIIAFKNAEENMLAEDFEKARKSYQEIQEKSPDKSYDAVLMLRVADTYFGEEKYSEAQVEYQNFLNYHPVNGDAVYAQYQVGMCSFKEMDSIDRDPTPAKVLVTEMRKLLEKYPKSGYEEAARNYISIGTNWLADYELYVARFYHKKEAYKSAAARSEALLKKYPGSSAEREALYYGGLSYLERGERDKARAMFETLIQKYPDMKKTAEAQISKLGAP